jgi:hypothetical protein
MHSNPKLTWKDIICINNKFYVHEFPVIWENDSHTTFNIDNFLTECAKVHHCSCEDITTLMMDNVDVPISGIKRLGIGREHCGGYINGIAEWLI